MFEFGYLHSSNWLIHLVSRIQTSFTTGTSFFQDVNSLKLLIFKNLLDMHLKFLSYILVVDHDTIFLQDYMLVINNGITLNNSKTYLL